MRSALLLVALLAAPALAAEVAGVRIEDRVTVESTDLALNGAGGASPSPARISTALLRIWLGDDPVSKDLKKALLGG